MIKQIFIYRNLFILVALIIINGCGKKVETEEDLIKGTWIKEGTNGTGAGNTLYFSKKNGIYTLSFDCSGSPGPDWPSRAETEYKFQKGKLSYLTYYDNSLGFYTADNFKWITKGEEFQILSRELLLYMSATYLVKYKKVD